MDLNIPNDEILSKRELAIEDFKIISSNNITGFYNSTEITTIFLIENKTGIRYNYFTLINFEENIELKKPQKLTKSPKTINENFKLGIIQFTLSISETVEFFDNILKNKFIIYGDEITISYDCILLPKQFVPHRWGVEPPLLNAILKPNYWGDSYIIEFFDETKCITKNLKRNEIDYINHIINLQHEIKIDLSKVYDRIGNIIFQFPLTFFNIDFRLSKNSTDLILSFYTHPKLSTELNISIDLKTSKDDIITGHKIIQAKGNEKEIIGIIGDSNELEVFIANINSSIIYHNSKNIFMKYYNINMNTGVAGAEPRNIVDRDGIKHYIQIFHPEPITIGRRKDAEYLDYIQKRVNENEIIMNSGDYQVFQKGQRKEALNFFREILLNSPTDFNEICLWDPYLTAIDIIETLYFENTGKLFKCITSIYGLNKIFRDDIKKNSKKSMIVILKSFIKKLLKINKIGNQVKANSTIVLIKQKILKQFIQYSTNHLNINLELRCQFNNYGYTFHDRFLILVPNNEFVLPVVYSLGTSVNSLGTSHHIIQKVTNPRVILNNFNTLWDEISVEECLILKIPEQKGLLNNEYK